MAKRQQLVAIYSMLDHVAKEASAGGYGLVTTLAAAAAEAAREELAALDRRERRHDRKREPEKVGTFA